jgi:hypothetical protein
MLMFGCEWVAKQRVGDASAPSMIRSTKPSTRPCTAAAFPTLFLTPGPPPRTGPEAAGGGAAHPADCAHRGEQAEAAEHVQDARVRDPGTTQRHGGGPRL